MYAFFECLTLLALTAVMSALVFAASVVLLMAGEGIAAIVRISRKTASVRTPDEVFMPSELGTE
jgi:hypothetical protein